MKILPIYQIQYSDSFLKENEDLLPDGFAWFYNIIKDICKKENRSKFPNSWFLFNKQGEFILECDEKQQIVYLNQNKIWHVFESRFGLDYIQIKELCKTILEQHFHCKVNLTGVHKYKYHLLLEQMLQK